VFLSVFSVYATLLQTVSHWFIAAKIHNISLLLVAESNQWKRYYNGNIGNTSAVSQTVLIGTSSFVIVSASC